jgi:hypothetical protein
LCSELLKQQPVQATLDPFRSVDYSDLPPLNLYTARDGTSLAFREYRVSNSSRSSEKQVAVLIHGSAADGLSMHVLAKGLADEGDTVFVPDLRGHGANQPRGDVRYLGQLDDDLADFVRQMRPRYPSTRVETSRYDHQPSCTARYRRLVHASRYSNSEQDSSFGWQLDPIG